MAGGAINIGGIEADLDLNTGNLERGLANAHRAMDGIEREIRQLNEDFSREAIGLQSYTDRMNELSTTVQTLAPKMQAAYHALGVTGNGLDVFNRQMQAGAYGAGRLGIGIM
jgi:hypothetical protein